MSPLEQLVYSYVRAMEQFEQTDDPGYRKTSGMFRERLRRQGVSVLDWTNGQEEVTVRLKKDDEVSLLRLPRAR